jgi:putative ABC transport system ATP-binding protein
MEASAQPYRLAAELRSVCVVYGAKASTVHALKSVSFEVRRGEVLLLMGPSGSGKSTVLQVLGCIRSVTSGTVLIGGRPVHQFDKSELAQLRRERIGFVFQHYNLLLSLRAWENVALALELRGLTGARIELASRHILGRLGLDHRADAYPEELSGGEKQRVAIARAVVGRPDLILADEPTAALDATSGSQVAQLLARIAHENGCAVVVVTHDARITSIADRLAYLDDGTIRWIRKNSCPQTKSSERSGNEKEDHCRSGLDDHLIHGAIASG